LFVCLLPCIFCCHCHSSNLCFAGAYFLHSLDL
jgi:hypothetical protein